MPISTSSATASGSAPPAPARRNRRKESSDSPVHDSDTLSWQFHIPLANNVFMLWDFLRIAFMAAVLIQTLALATGYVLDHDTELLFLAAAGGLALLAMAVYALLTGIRSSSKKGVSR